MEVIYKSFLIKTKKNNSGWSLYIYNGNTLILSQDHDDNYTEEQVAGFGLSFVDIFDISVKKDKK